MDIYVPGYEPAFQAFQLWYLLIGAFSLFLLLGGIGWDLNRRLRPRSIWMGLLAILALLAMGTPIGWLALLMLHMQLLATGPLGASAIAGMLTLFSIWAFFYLFIGPDTWAELQAQRVPTR